VSFIVKTDSPTNDGTCLYFGPFGSQEDANTWAAKMFYVFQVDQLRPPVAP
jgi:hypothetical protein